jgi:hypothetical protein
MSLFFPGSPSRSSPLPLPWALPGSPSSSTVRLLAALEVGMLVATFYRISPGVSIQRGISLRISQQRMKTNALLLGSFVLYSSNAFCNTSSSEVPDSLPE